LGIENTLALAEELAERGFRVVPHLSARLVRGEGHLKEILRRMERASLRDLFVVGGDVGEPVGPFAGGADLLRAMAEQGHGIERIGVPAYPEGHPLVPEEALLRALAEKQPFASYLVTQICFDPDTILDWLAGIRRKDIRLPAYVGVPGVVERRRLLGISLKIGIGASVRYLRKQRGPLGRLMLHGGYSPDHLVRTLAPHVGDPDYSIRGFHINTFNQIEGTEWWRRGMLDALDGEGA
jgi:methylenetetrahydrofolate reductase (NADPH)